MKAIICDACKKLLNEKEVEYCHINISRLELCKECKVKVNEINKWEEEQHNKFQEEYKKLQEEYSNKLKEIGINFY